MPDERVRDVLARLEQEDADERARGLPPEMRSRQVARTTGRFLFALVAPQWDCEVLEIGGSRGYSTIWLASGVRRFGGRVLSLEQDPEKTSAWRENIAAAGLEEWAELVEGDARQSLAAIDDVFDVVFLDAEKEDYEELFHLARAKLEPERSSSRTTSCRTRRPSAPTAGPGSPIRRWSRSPCRSTEASSCPLCSADILAPTAERRWSESGDFQYGQWRYQRVEARPRHLRGIA
jgi:O-methyltransferase